MREPRARPLGGLIGVIHLPPMPGDPAYRGGGFERVRTAALRDAEALAAGRAQAIVVENFGSSPFRKGTRGARLEPHQVAAMALIAEEVRMVSGLPVGLNCLRSDGVSAIGIAAAAAASFVRINVHTGAYVTDQGVIEGEAESTLRYRRALEVDSKVAICADLLVKHAAPLVPLDPAQATAELFERGRADAVIVTGSATGAPVDRALLEAVRRAAGERVVLIGSGMSPERAEALAPLADGAIVGTWIKEEGRLERPIDAERVRALSDALAATLRTPTG